MRAVVRARTILSTASTERAERRRLRVDRGQQVGVRRLIGSRASQGVLGGVIAVGLGTALAASASSPVAHKAVASKTYSASSWSGLIAAPTTTAPAGSPLVPPEPTSTTPAPAPAPPTSSVCGTGSPSSTAQPTSYSADPASTGRDRGSGLRPEQRIAVPSRLPPHSHPVVTGDHPVPGIVGHYPCTRPGPHSGTPYPGDRAARRWVRGLRVGIHAVHIAQRPHAAHDPGTASHARSSTGCRTGTLPALRGPVGRHRLQSGGQRSGGPGDRGRDAHPGRGGERRPFVSRCPLRVGR